MAADPAADARECHDLAEMHQGKVARRPRQRLPDQVADGLDESGRRLSRKVVANTPPDLAMLVATGESAKMRQSTA
jgi:hypothetical protein